MGLRQCIVCKREVPEGYESEHLSANHFGPHIFWFNMRQHQTMEPSMTMGDVVKMVDGNTRYHVFEEREGGDIPWGHGVAVDLTNTPRFYTVPPATYPNPEI